MEKKRAYLSVYDKTGIVEFSRYLVEYGYELVATEGTARAIAEGGLPVLSAHDLTGYPEPLDGKVRALHPAIYMGIIAGAMSPEQLKGLGDGNVYPIQLAVVNLYPFERDMVDGGLSFAEASSHIDAAGVALIDAAAKNYLHTVVVCDPADYERVLCDLAAGEIPEDERKYFMYKAFSYTAFYDALVAQYLSRELNSPFPKNVAFPFEKAQDIRYGENPHQRAAVYREPLLKEGSLARAKQLAGPSLTYNNLGDSNAALELVKEFDTPAAVVFKHCAVFAAATGDTLYDAFSRIAGSDLKGGILAVNAIVDARAAALFKKAGLEVVLAVGFTPEAMAELRYLPDLVLLEIPDIRSKVQFSTYDMTKIYGGLLVQTYDTSLFGSLECPTKRKPTPAEERALLFNYKVAKHARSSAIVIGKEKQTVGIGSGQATRATAIALALSLASGMTRGSVLASDAAFDNADSVKTCIKAGIDAVICTGTPSPEVVKLMDKHGIALLASDSRHFKN